MKKENPIINNNIAISLISKYLKKNIDSTTNEPPMNTSVLCLVDGLNNAIIKNGIRINGTTIISLMIRVIKNTTDKKKEN